MRSLRAFDRSHHVFHGRNPLGTRVSEDTATVGEDFKLVVGKLHLWMDAVFRYEFALKAPGQASDAASNQATVDFDLRILVHNYFCSLTSTLAMVSAQSSFKTAAVALV